VLDKFGFPCDGAGGGEGAGGLAGIAGLGGMGMGGMGGMSRLAAGGAGGARHGRLAAAREELFGCTGAEGGAGGRDDVAAWVRELAGDGLEVRTPPPPTVLPTTHPTVLSPGGGRAGGLGRLAQRALAGRGAGAGAGAGAG
jgi:hypothetical protein